MDDTGRVGAVSLATVELMWRRAEAMRDGVSDFTRRLIKTQSLPGHERAVAELVAAEMRSLGYDDVWTDEAGNVVGHIKATRTGGKRVMLNTHMDHVDVGDWSRWPHPPYGAALIDDEIWGRGASDLKGALACQVYAGAMIRKLGVDLPNDVYVAGVVLEEVGGLGSMCLAEKLPVDFVIVGEPSANRIALGHRGRFEVHVTVRGKSVHASVPETGINPLYSVSRFLLSLRELRWEAHPDALELGPTSIAPTLFSTDQSSPNVLPNASTNASRRPQRHVVKW